MAKAQKSGKGKAAAKAKAAKKAARPAIIEAPAVAALDETNGAAPSEPDPVLEAAPEPASALAAAAPAKPERKRRRAADASNANRPEPTLKILETRVLRGPNYWAREPVIRHARRPRRARGVPEQQDPGLRGRARRAAPDASRTTPARLGRRGGFITRLRDGTWAGHVAEHIALELQNLAGTDVRHGKTRGTGEHGQYNVIYEYREEQVGIEAGRMAVALVNHLVAPDDPAFAFDFMAELERLIRLAERQAFGPVHAGAPRRGRRPRHPVHPARPPLPRPARARASTSSGSGRR